MKVPVTFYLLRTLITGSRVTGLKIRLEVVQATKNLTSFDEKEIPAATLLSHGLYLASSSANTAHNPMLVAILNRSELQQDLVRSEFGVIIDSEGKKQDDRGVGSDCIQMTSGGTCGPLDQDPNSDCLSKSNSETDPSV